MHTCIYVCVRMCTCVYVCAAVEVYEALEASGLTLISDLSEATVDVLQHKYGDDVAGTARDGVSWPL